MKLSTLSLGLLALAADLASAFPSQLSEAMLQSKARTAVNGAAGGCPFAKRYSAKVEDRAECPFAKRQSAGVVPPFDAKQQYVSTEGAHAFVAPSGNDQRGPCPGLNAMANHGYLPHTGIGTIQDFITGCQEAFGMGADLATLLATYGAVFNGDLTSFSIGGPTPSLLNLGGLLGAPQGLSGSHNKYEGDASATRGDLYEHGNDYLVQLPQFTSLYELGQANNNSVDLKIITSFRNKRFRESIEKNPYFFNAPFPGIIAVPGGWAFIYRFMGNKSAEHPMGLLDGETLKSFFSISGDYPNFNYTPGHEKFPNNWYKRNLVDYYTIPYFSQDLSAMSLAYPQFLSVGGNTGTNNSFVGVNVTSLTSGVYNADTLLQGNNAICFSLQASLMEAPDILSGLYSDVNPALSQLGSAITAATGALGCPILNTIDKGQLNQFPGWTGVGVNKTH